MKRSRLIFETKKYGIRKKITTKLSEKKLKQKNKTKKKIKVKIVTVELIKLFKKSIKPN